MSFIQIVLIFGALNNQGPGLWPTKDYGNLGRGGEVMAPSLCATHLSIFPLPPKTFKMAPFCKFSKSYGQQRLFLKLIVSALKRA